MTEKQRNVFKVFKVFGTLTPHQAAKKMGFKESAPITQQIKFLLNQGLLKKEGTGKKTKYAFNQKK